MKTILNILSLICLMIPLPMLASEPGQEPMTPLPRLNRELIRIGEGKPYCHAGYGTQRLTFNIEGNSVRSDKVSNAYMPGFDLTSTTFLRFGCKTDLLFFDFSTVDDSMRFNRNVTYNDIEYNSIKYQYRVFAVGHSMSLIPHRLYLDLGLGYGLLDYHLGLYGGEVASQYESDTISTGGVLLRMSVRVIISHYVMVHWQHDKSISSDSIVDYSGQLGLNFISRF